MLGSFLFRGEEVDKKVKVLSGGERNRLALCKLMLQPFNVLIMDEPTNHLDIKSKNVLKEALNKFEGTLIIVSHDRDFLQGLTNKVYEFKDAKIKEYLGDINYFLQQRKLEDMRAVEKKTKIKAAPVKNDLGNSENKTSYKDQKKLKSLKNKLSNTEAKITKLEKDLEAQNLELATNYEQAAAKPDFMKKYKTKKRELNALMAQWEELQENLEVLS
jgi:ATP-binding cassette subfamily F protein 3